MENPRKHGLPPYRVAVLHGGPGAPGAVAPVARELSRRCACGVLEPFQTASSIDGQIDELTALLTTHGDPPLTLIGHSWGAWLGLLAAARHPRLARKLILVGSGPFEERFAEGIMQTRLARLTLDERIKASNLMEMLEDSTMTELAKLIAKTDAVDPLPTSGEENHDGLGVMACDGGIYQSVWREAAALRRGGELLRQAARLQCPVLAIHGDCDPHPAAGVEAPLSRILPDFRFMLLSRCGHEPWIERAAREPFFEILHAEIQPSVSAP